MLPVLLLLAAYFCGSIPFGYLIVRARENADVRQSGSGGTGATNVSRRAGKTAGLVTLLLDAAKGMAAVILARAVVTGGSDASLWIALAGLAAMVGHIFPVWLGFRGGKGVATGLGVFVGLAPLAAACAGLVFVGVVWTTRYVSLGSITAASALPVIIWLLSDKATSSASSGSTIIAAVLGCALIVFTHRANVGRLLRGTESKFR